MGADNHEAIATLFSAQTLDGRATYPDGGSVPSGVETRRIPRSVADAWSDTRDHEAWEYGHGGYTGTFAEKHGFVVFGTADVDKATLEAAGSIVSQLSWTPDYVPTTPIELDAVKAFGFSALAKAAEQYDDKWGDAVAFVGKDYVWFGGLCSS
jgi:hypothetical protein